ncbi:MAG TPA: TetR/AcrR family transcriptional regulator [Enorma massiliensis]|uniref:TetR/AcrR family transcriptional regulator n=1 Tax=Enorma massiliensis TaxID=1472761 RepID=UPI001D67DC68|nr:TetR/AcrR family transcriptional regulator [Enorma massiliensis]HJG61724.1 TetR/AcrR family transcriptional regulator [Enorma massiliensis]
MPSQLTKRALEESLKRLLLEKPLGKITIADITNDCGISRMTFYYHFQDIYDLVEWACEEDAARAIAGNKTADTWQTGLLDTFLALRENKPFIASIYHDMSREQVERFLVPVVSDLVKSVVDEHAARRHVREQDRDFIARFFAHALIGTVLDWIARDMRDDPQQLVQRVATIADGAIETALDRLEIPGGYIAGSEGNVPEGSAAP